MSARSTGRTDEDALGRFFAAGTSTCGSGGVSDAALGSCAAEEAITHGNVAGEPTSRPPAAGCRPQAMAGSPLLPCAAAFEAGCCVPGLPAVAGLGHCIVGNPSPTCEAACWAAWPWSGVAGLAAQAIAGKPRGVAALAAAKGLLGPDMPPANCAAAAKAVAFSDSA